MVHRVGRGHTGLALIHDEPASDVLSEEMRMHLLTSRGFSPTNVGLAIAREGKRVLGQGT